MALRFQALRGRSSQELPPSRWHSSRCHSMLGWRDTTDHDWCLGGRRPASRSPARRSGSDGCAGVGLLPM